MRTRHGVSDKLTDNDMKSGEKRRRTDGGNSAVAAKSPKTPSKRKRFHSAGGTPTTTVQKLVAKKSRPEDKEAAEKDSSVSPSSSEKTTASHLLFCMTCDRLIPAEKMARHAPLGHDTVKIADTRGAASGGAKTASSGGKQAATANSLNSKPRADGLFSSYPERSDQPNNEVREALFKILYQ